MLRKKPVSPIPETTRNTQTNPNKQHGQPPKWMSTRSRDVGFPHSNEPELDEGELWAGVTLNGWKPMTWAPMKGAMRSMKPRVKIKQHQPT
ncbi:MAG: hypothetical protein QW067_12000 [Thermofilaceae archaeon]